MTIDSFIHWQGLLLDISECRNDYVFRNLHIDWIRSVIVQIDSENIRSASTSKHLAVRER
jgi:hypothetical protein